MLNLLTDKLIDKLLKALLEPTNQSMDRLRAFESKFDAQAEAKVKAALRSLKRLDAAGRPSNTSLEMALNSLTESSEYFQKVRDQINQERSELYSLSFKNL